jgi:hypothetical protein
MHDFTDTKKTSSKNFVSEAIRVFEDRASLRVTDVSSVVFRDFVIWYAYYFLSQAELPAAIPKNVILNVHTILGNRDQATFEDILSGTISLEKWGESL